MIGYAVKPDKSWRCVDTETMALDIDEEFQINIPCDTDSDGGLNG